MYPDKPNKPIFEAASLAAILACIGGVMYDIFDKKRSDSAEAEEVVGSNLESSVQRAEVTRSDMGLLLNEIKRANQIEAKYEEFSNKRREAIDGVTNIGSNLKVALEKRECIVYPGMGVFDLTFAYPDIEIFDEDSFNVDDFDDGLASVNLQSVAFGYRIGQGINGIKYTAMFRNVSYEADSPEELESVLIFAIFEAT